MSDSNRKFRVGLGVSGGIAAYKAIEVLRLLQKAGCEVRVAMTRHATEFVQPLTFRALTETDVLVDDYAPENPDPIAHINFSQNIDLLLIVPATANILAKFAGGIADDFLSSTYLASTAPVLVAPAMNTTMWFHPATARNIELLKKDGVLFVEPISGELACKTVGTGKLEDVENIARQALEILSNRRSAVSGQPENQAYDSRPSTLDLKGERLLITTGGTREEIDPVRFISNHSSGKMGFALAETAAKRGALVTVVAASTSVAPPENVEIISAISAEAMHRAVMSELKNATVFVGAAAVADYRPATRAENKIKKTEDKLFIELEKTADILAEVSKHRHDGLIVVGFAAETDDVEAHARSKMHKKHLDLIVANDVGSAGIGFGSENNEGLIFSRDAENPIVVSLMTKREMADKILDEVIKFRKRNG
ncbi:MAG TPA: bifunctional phosphopantothenoylcysteine decarboxylase/phosphopantothenate--cysteine ligase CoaBC [Pyrinomonadaceae bacterium]|nr:bifunctional phosphopantothenoylcysteine decarboxylase/phosphopantothenate--cysteine ligase CoaBC [Pyrinomonadaceae bacterium]